MNLFCFTPYELLAEILLVPIFFVYLVLLYIISLKLFVKYLIKPRKLLLLIFGLITFNVLLILIDLFSGWKLFPFPRVYPCQNLFML